uniref:S8 family serine peptidase n=1 Tax=Actinotalea sp. TaxID=1872145 RepID=UPI003566C8EB
MTRRVLAAVTCAVLSLPLVAPIATAGPSSPPADGPGLTIQRGTGLAAPADAAARLGAALATASGPVTAFVQLDSPSGVETAEAGGDAAAVEAAAEEVEALAEEVLPDGATSRAAAAAPETVSVTSDLVAGMVVTGDAGSIRALADDPNVVGVHLMTPKTALNKGTDAFTGALAAWEASGQTGEGVRIGVIDTGLDYTHADFGGPGTPEAYAQAYGTDGSDPVPTGLYDPAKYLGGWDFAGPTYDAGSSSPSARVPNPDANPIDGADGTSGHGTHVAGTAAGYGVQADGTTFRGSYAALTDVSDWRIGPGSAPGAGIYALKVFGDGEGSTNLTIDALEWAADPDGDGDYSDHLDVLNLSLGSDGSPADDPENLFIDELSALGVVSVIASGNAGDLTDIGGTPGNATSALTVANSVGDAQTVDAVEVTGAGDASLLGLHAAQNTINYTGEDVTAPVVFLGATVDGCTPLTDQADQIAGRIVWLFWDDDAATRACGSTAQWNNAAAAGAVGAIVGTTDPVFSYGLSGSDLIPGAMLTADATTALMPEIQAGTLTVHLGPSLANASFISIEGLADTLNAGSSRGVHGSLGIVKPDVAAPGTGISSASSGSGSDRSTKSGTSMSTPHVAGIAALVRAAHPEWDAQQVKTNVMNTAIHDVRSSADQASPVYGPERVGSGRVDALAATSNSVLAASTDDPALVSVTFGIVPVGATTVVQKKTVTVTNTGTSAARLTTSFAQSTSSGGATISVSPSSITVPPGKSRTVTLTLRADPSTLAKEIDPTSESAYFGGGVPREFVSSVSGRLVLTAPDGSTLRVPVHAAPKLVSEMSADPVALGPGESTGTLSLSGRGVSSGGWTSLVAPFDLVATSPRLDDSAATGASPSVIASGDL